ncbi:hypothetical protein [Confluentibacter citreus]|uniref:hypothetical protein n=1 Tax=Confluentibacter citreus TaxID=2007307 RepID=UPI000C284CBD|nr:hypothetical protein [Confluentibacter citreus]
MSSKKLSEKLKQELSKNFNFTLAASGTYIYSRIAIPMQFELFITEESIGLKYPIGNLLPNKIIAINTLLQANTNRQFVHRTYGSNSTVWSVWDLKLENTSHEAIIEIVEELRALNF